MPDTEPRDWREERRRERQERLETMRAWRDERRRERWRESHHGPGRHIAALFLIGLGALFLLANLGIVYIEDVWEYWPVILIVFGLIQIASWRRHPPIGGMILTTIGSIFLLRNLGILYGSVWGYIWPAVLIAVGAAMLMRASGGWDWGPPAPSTTSGPANSLKESAVFGSIRRKIDSQEFEGGKIEAVFGGVRVDLRQAGTKLDEIFIRTDAVFGGVDLFVPETWRVTVRGDGVFGGFEDRTMARPATDTKSPHLVVTGSAVFGNVSVRN